MGVRDPNRSAGQRTRARPRLRRRAGGDGTLELLRLIWAVDHGLQKTSKAMGRRWGITGPQRLVLRFVGERPDVSAGELARLLHLDPSTLTGVLRRLEQRGLLRRSADPGDARRARLDLTPRGRTRLAARVGMIESAVRTALASLDQRHVAGARAVLGALAEALGVPMDDEG